MIFFCLQFYENKIQVQSWGSIEPGSIGPGIYRADPLLFCFSPSNTAPRYGWAFRVSSSELHICVQQITHLLCCTPPCQQTGWPSGITSVTRRSDGVSGMGGGRGGGRGGRLMIIAAWGGGFQRQWLRDSDHIVLVKQRAQKDDMSPKALFLAYMKTGNTSPIAIAGLHVHCICV